MATKDMASATERLDSLSRRELIDLWTTLTAPDPHDVAGEYKPWIPPDLREAVDTTHKSLGFTDWFGKAYSLQSHGRWQGQGYNIYESAEGVHRINRFGWSIADSEYDGRPALIMEYQAFNNVPGEWDLRDELRVLEENFLLGMYWAKNPVPGFTSLEIHEATGRSEINMFGLVGQPGPWVGADDPTAELHSNAAA
jgi:hypothetical protein